MALRPEDLPSDPAAPIEIILAFDGDNESLRAQIATLKTLIFGARSERAAVVCAEQLALDLGRTGADAPPPTNDDEPQSGAAKTKRNRPKRNIGALRTGDRPGFDAVAVLWGPNVHRIGEDIGEALDRVPARLRVLCTIRPKYACRACEGPVVQAAAPARSSRAAWRRRR